MNKFAILIACEESQCECLAWRNAGFEAYSCDLQECCGNHPEWHIVGDVTPLLHGQLDFVTQVGVHVQVKEWRLIIAHPPCTYLTASSNNQMFFAPGVINPNREKLGRDAASFFMECYNARAPFVCVENPRPFRMWQLPKPDCRVNPYEFGEPWSKRTYYWLRNLPPLLATAICPEFKSWVHCTRGGKKRSKSFPGIANAMVEQWRDIITE